MNGTEDGPTTLMQRLDDRINPIVVKELRQAVEGRFAVAMLFTFLLISLITIAIFLFQVPERNPSFNLGREALMALHGILVGTCLLFLPVYAAVRFASERSDTNVDLLFITTIRPRSIVWGKTLATTILAVLVYSACMPFMTLTYLMRGVDLPSISLVLGIGFLAVVASIQVAIFTACLTTHRGFRVLLALLLIAGLVMMFTSAVQGAWALVYFGLGSAMHTAEFWGGALTVVGITLAALVVLHSWSVALVTPPSANRALPVRLTMTAVWLATGAIATAWAFVAGEEEALYVWGITGVLFFAVGLLIAISERETWGPRVARTIPRRRLLRPLAFFLYSGAAGGVVWATVMMALSWYLTVTLVKTLKPNDNDLNFFRYAASALFFFALAYSMTGLLIRRALLRRLVKPMHTWTLAFLVWALSMLLPPLIAFLLHGALGPRKPHWWMLASPMALTDDDTLHVAPVVAGVWAAVACLLNLPWFVRQCRAFRPPAVTTS